MTTTGESLWSGLLNRSDEVGTFGIRSKTVQSTVKIGSSYIVGPEMDVSKFRFSPFSILGYPPGTPAKVFLTFSGNTLFSASTVVRLSMKWPHTFDLVKGQWVVLFHGIKPKTPIKCQLVVLSSPPGVKNPKRNIILLAPKRGIQQIADISFAFAALAKRDYPPRLSSRRTPWPLRAKKLSSPQNQTSVYVSGTEQTGIPWSSTNVTYNSYSRSYTSVNTPGFGHIKRANLPVNPYSMTLTKTNLGQGIFFRTRRSDKFYVNRAIASSSIIDEIPSDPPFNTELDGRAIRKLADRAGVDINNIAQDIVQFRQTTNMIANSAIRIAASVTALRRGNFSAAVQNLYSPKRQTYRNRPGPTRNTANNWLELQYGWKPLLQDIDGSMRSLAAFLHDTPVIRTVRASAHSEAKTKWPVRFFNQPVDFGQSGNPLTNIGFGNRISFQSVRYACRFRLDNSTKAFLSQTGFTSPVNLAWELLPYSFVVDWFLPIGPYLESMSAFEGMEFLDGSKTIFIRNKDLAQVAFDGTLPRTPAYDSRIRALYDRDVVVVQRTKLLSFPKQQFPQFKNPFSVTHAANALALLVSAFRK